MVVKKKTVKSSKTKPSDKTPTIPVAPSESMPVVSQVVEVIEEKSGNDTQASGADTSAFSSIAPGLSPAPAKSVESSPTMEQAKSLDEVKRQEIDELFVAAQPQTVNQPIILPEISLHQRGPSKTVLWLIVVALGLAIFVGGGLVVVTQGAIGLPSLGLVKPTPTPIPSPTPTPTPALNLNRADLAVQILNGGGVPGAAAKLKGFLEAKGYKVSSTGNTEEYTYEQTEVFVKAVKANYLWLLRTDLEGEYTIGTAAATLTETVAVDARVIVGKK